MRTEGVRKMKLTLFRAIGLTPVTKVWMKKVKLFDPFVIDNAQIYLTKLISFLKNVSLITKCRSINSYKLFMGNLEKKQYKENNII